MGKIILTFNGKPLKTESGKIIVVNTNTTATIEDNILVLSNAELDGNTLIVSGATVEGNTLTI